jgi:hypothetical protein
MSAQRSPYETAARGRINLPDDRRVTILCEELGAIAARYVLAGISTVQPEHRREVARRLVLAQVKVMARMIVQTTVRHARQRGDATAVTRMLAGIEERT